MFGVSSVKLIVCIGVAMIGFGLSYLDMKRTSDPNYKANVMKKRKEIQERKTQDMLFRMLPFPITNKKKHITRFAVSEIKKGEASYAIGDYDKAIEHLANGLSMIDNKCLLCYDLRERIPLKMYREIKKQIRELQQINKDIV